jgi:hypothetical protein
MQALVHLQARSARRAAKIQELAGDVAGAVQTGFDGLGATAQDMTDAAQLAGRLVAAIDARLPIVKAAHELVARTRQVASALLPPEVRQAAAEAIHRDAQGLSAQDAARFLGMKDDLEGLPDILGGELTGEFETLPERGDDAATIPPLTVPLRALGQEPGKAARHGAKSRQGAAGDTRPAEATPSAPTPADTQPSEDAQAQLLELWRLLGQLGVHLAQEYRTLLSLSRELGKLSHTVRTAEAGVVHGIASLDAARATLKQWQQLAGSNPAPTHGERDVSPFAAGANAEPAATPRGPSPSRPLPPLAATALEPAVDALYGIEGDTLPVEVTPPGGWLNAGDLIDPTLRTDGGDDRPRAGDERGG